MDAETLGAATYNKVRRAMSADPSVKDKINNLVAELQSQDEEGDVEGEDI